MEILSQTLVDEDSILAGGVGAVREKDEDEIIARIYPEACPREALVPIGIM